MDLSSLLDGYLKLGLAALGAEAETTAGLASERLGVCLHCEALEPRSRTCQSCGCWLPAKARARSARCPKNRWVR